jgi:hypothetical protein
VGLTKKNRFGLFLTALLALAPIMTLNTAHAAPTAAIIIDPGSVSSYSGSGTTVTSIGSNTQSGTMSNITYSSTDGGKFTFNGTSSAIAFSSWDFTSTFTISAWLKPNSVAQINTLIANTSNNTESNGFKAGWNNWNSNSQKMTLEAGSGTIPGTVAQTSGAQVSYGKWQYLTWVVNKTSGTATFYVNGELVAASNSTISTGFATSAAWYIGKMTSSNYWLKADLGLLKIYTSNLTQSDISSEFVASQSRYSTPAKPTIGTNPNSASIRVGETLTLTSSASIVGAGTLSYQWQYSTDTGTSWSSVSGGTGASTSEYSFQVASKSQDQYQYRLAATNTYGSNTSAAYSNAATLSTQQGTPQITFNYAAGSTVATTYRSTFNIVATSPVPGAVTFLTNGKRIPGCISLPINGSVTCTYKPAIKGVVTIQAKLVPSITADYSTVTRLALYIKVSARTSTR